MSEISNIEIAILGLLCEHHHYAYRLEEIMNKRSMHAWADLEYSSIENVLGELEEKKLVKVENRKTLEKPLKKIYSITYEGKLVFNNKIKYIMSSMERIIYPFDLSIANMHLLSHDEIIQSLNNYLKSLDERINFITRIIKFQEENKIPYNFIAISHRSKALLIAEKDWLERFIKSINKDGF
jgi:DNA-binding PadR family transcriptional regulator